MFNVNFYEKRDLVLCQLRENVPEEGEGIKLKGRKGTVLSVEKVDEKTVHVLIETLKKADDSQKKR
ncbi:hypothetical protein [Evansella tamaricis]|uniref:Preprotein translocase subunit SecA n=1 Tax=Evansella tamaricis TaxID=2069301 RepID=A0ABS6JF50_9BACI|nr:hypothetical protein [Evansella tamaricis]MBU9712288.1 hypothetical protein [Evansella tamaricis]